MKSPIKHILDHTNCAAELKKIIPRGSLIESYLFFSGNLEFNLAEADMFINANTFKYVVHEFWECAMEDNKKIYDLVISEGFEKFKNKEFIYTLQETWPRYKDPYIRSALFFLLNRCSDTGSISSGKFQSKNLNSAALSHLLAFRHKNLHLQYLPDDNLIESISKSTKFDYLLLPMGKFSYSLFQHGVSLGFEESRVDHRKLSLALKGIKKKWILLYKNHKAIYQIYQNFNITMIGKHGMVTRNKNLCEDIIVTNF